MERSFLGLVEDWWRVPTVPESEAFKVGPGTGVLVTEAGASF